MNYTENHHLPQWEESDRIMRTDFNQMCADIEAGLDEGLASVDGARVEAAAASAVVQAAADAAQATADTALAAANNAYCPGKESYSIGSYKGNGGTTTITLGFRPRFVIISGMFITANGTTTGFSFLGEVHANSSAFTLLTDGFSVHKVTRQDPDWGEQETYPYLNSENRNYIYIAFR